MNQRARPLLISGVALVLLSLSLVAGPSAAGPLPDTVPSWRLLGPRRGSSGTLLPAIRRGPLTPLRGAILARLHRVNGGGTDSRRDGSPSSTARAPATGSFDTITAGAAGPVASPGDPTGALGQSFSVVAVNKAVAVFDRTGLAVFGPARLRGLYGNLPTGQDTDPKVVYDAYDDEFVLVFLLYSRAASNLVMVSIPGATADQKGTWCPLIMSGDQVRGNGLQQADYPGLGFTQDRVALSTNSFDASGRRLEYSQIVSIKKSQLYDCNGVPKLTVFAGRSTRDPDGSAASTIQPAVTVGGSSPTTQYLASFDWNGPDRASDLVVWRLAETAGGLKLARTALRVGKVAIPPWGRQCGADPGSSNAWWDTGDLRLTSAFYDADVGRLYSAHAVKASFAGGSAGSAVRWYEVAPSPTLSSSSVSRKGLIGGTDLFAAWPSVATDGGDTLFVDYSEAAHSGRECLSIVAATVPPGSNVPSSASIHSGDARYEYASGPERWGDYSAISRDPTDPTQMALFNAYASSDGAPPTPLFQAYEALVHA